MRFPGWVGVVLLLLCSCSSGSGEATDSVGSEVEADGLFDSTGLDARSEETRPSDLLELEADAIVLPDTMADLQPDITEIQEGFSVVSLAPTGTLRAVWGDGEQFFAVGDGGRIQRRQGRFWAPMPVPTQEDLFAVFGTSLSDLWACGAGGTVLSFDGETWNLANTGIDDLDEVTLRGVWGEEGHMFFVGDKGTILHKAGPNWSKEASSTSYNLYGIWARSLVDVYVSAGAGTILHRIGSTWTSSSVGSGNTQMTAIRGVDEGPILAAGTGGSITVLDGGSWSMQVSNDPWERNLHALWSYAEDDSWLIGEDGALVHWNGSKWLIEDIKGPYFKLETFRGLWGWEGDQGRRALAVGERGAMLEFDGETWSDLASGLEADVLDMAGPSQGALAVGEDGLLLRVEGTQWFALDRRTDKTLYGVADLGDDRFLVVGQDGVVIEVDGNQSTLLDPACEETLMGVCSNGKYVAAVGVEGTLVTSTDGVEWTRRSTGVFDTLRDCSMDEMGRVTAVGDLGRILRLDGSALEEIPVATLANLQRVVANDEGRVAIVGDNGLILEGDGLSFSRLHESPGVFLYGAAWKDSSLVAVGWNGTVVTWAGGEVELVQIPGAGLLRQVWWGDWGGWYAVGTHGAILRFDP